MIVEKHQLTGVDERERGFSRLVELEQADGFFLASLRYETTLATSGRCETSTAALQELVQLLQGRGYTHLRTRLDFQGQTYLGSQEPWIEYPDPERPMARARYPAAFLGGLRRLLWRLFS